MSGEKSAILKPSGAWNYSRNRARHSLFSDLSNCILEVRACQRSCGSMHRPKVDGYDLILVDYGTGSEKKLDHGFDVQELKLQAEEWLRRQVVAINHWGRQPLYQAKIGTLPGSLIMVRRARKFYVEQRIEFAELDDVRGMSVGMSPKWQHGIIWKIEGNRLFVNRV